MLSKIDKNRILDLRSQDYSYQAIHEKLGFAIDTIMNICQQEKKQKNQEKAYSQREISNSNDPIIMLRRIEIDIGNVIETGKLNDRDRRKWEKRREDIRAILKSEVDDRISKVSADAIEKRDIQWSREIENNYVRKEIVAGFENTIKEKDDIIVKLRSKIEKSEVNLIEKENKISRLEYSKNCEIQDLKDQLDDIYDKNIILNNENWRLQEYIDNRLDLDVNIKQDRLNNEIDAFNSEKKDFFRFEDKQQLNLDKLYLESQTKLETVEKLEKKLEKQSEEIKQREDEFYKTRENFFKDVRKTKSEIKEKNEQIAKQWDIIKKKEEQQKIKDKQFHKMQAILEKNGFLNHFSLPCPHCTRPMFFDATEPEINQKIKSLFGNYMHSECRLKNEQSKRVTLIPVSYSGEPVIQSGFPSVTHSGEETKVFESSGGNMIQSGCSPIYYFGTKNLDKTSKKAGTVSS